MNRQITGRIASYHFAPTELSRRNLLGEGVDPGKILVTGNTVIDALHTVVERIRSDRELAGRLAGELLAGGYDTARLDGSRRMVLITGHRRENFGDGFVRICSAIKHLAETYPDVDFVYPMHLNPNVRRPIHEAFGNSSLPNLFLIEPLEYLPFVCLMERSAVVLTDSGAFRRKPRGSASPCSSCAIRPSVPRRSTPERSAWSAPIMTESSGRQHAARRPRALQDHESGGQSLRRREGLRPDRTVSGVRCFRRRSAGRMPGAPSWNFERAVRRAVCGR